MYLVALTGGIGSGKSSVADRLASLGAVVVDSDLTVRALQQPGEPVFNAMVARWGQSIVGDDGQLNRPAVAAIVFGDPAELEAINGIVHPAVRDATKARIDELAAADKKNGVDTAVILDIPLLVETKNRHGADHVIVVDCPTDIAIERLVSYRGFDADDAASRIAAQATRQERLAVASFVVDNSGDAAGLDAEVDRCWAWIEGLSPSEWPPAESP